MGAAFFSLLADSCFRAGVEFGLLAYFLVEHFGAEISQCRPGDQNGRDESKHAECGKDQNQVTTFHGIHKAALSFHRNLLSVKFIKLCLTVIKSVTLKPANVNG